MRHRVIFGLIICFVLAAGVVRMRAPSLTSAASEAQSWILTSASGVIGEREGDAVRCSTHVRL